jgi:hypothetical protein
MFFFDPFLFALFNADAQTHWFSIQLARALSAWLPNLSGILVLIALVFGSPATRRTMLMLLLSMATAWLIARLIRWGFPARARSSSIWARYGFSMADVPAFPACMPAEPLPWPWPSAWAQPATASRWSGWPG